MNVEVPQVRKVFEKFDDFALLLRLRCSVRSSGARRKANGDAAGVPHRLFRVLEDLANDPNSIFQGATVLIVSLIGRREKLSEQVAVGRVDIDDVESGPLGAFGSFDVPSAKISNIALVHGAALGGEHACRREGERTHASVMCGKVGARTAAVPELDARQGAMAVDLLDHQRVGADVLLVP